jgi:hypothetical protein
MATPKIDPPKMIEPMQVPGQDSIQSDVATNLDHLRFLRSLGGPGDQGMKTKFSRNKSRVKKKKKP